MKKEHSEKMAQLAQKEEEAKKQVRILFVHFSAKQDYYVYFHLGGNMGTNVSRMDGNNGKKSQ